VPDANPKGPGAVHLSDKKTTFIRGLGGSRGETRANKSSHLDAGGKKAQATRLAEQAGVRESGRGIG